MPSRVLRRSLLAMLGFVATACVVDAERFIGGKKQHDTPDATVGQDGGTSDEDAAFEADSGFQNGADVGNEVGAGDGSLDRGDDALADAIGGETSVSDAAPDIGRSDAANEAGIVGFSQTCRPATGNCPGTTWLCMECQSSDGKWVTTSLDTNLCIANANGMLQWQYHGAYGNSCTVSIIHVRNGANYVESVVNASCRRFDGSLNATSLKLNAGISNVNGTLHCDNGGA